VVLVQAVTPVLNQTAIFSPPRAGFRLVSDPCLVRPGRQVVPVPGFTSGRSAWFGFGFGSVGLVVFSWCCGCGVGRFVVGFVIFGCGGVVDVFGAAGGRGGAGVGGLGWCVRLWGRGLGGLWDREGLVGAGGLAADLPRGPKVRNVVRVATDEGQQTPTKFPMKIVDFVFSDSRDFVGGPAGIAGRIGNSRFASGVLVG
jgi:hypothetical protein